MCPTLPTLDPADGAITNAVVSSNQPLQPRVFADRINLGLRQFVCAAPLSAIGRAVQNLVCMVVFAGIPTKIADVVIRRIAVIVATLHAIWARADERRQNQSVWAANLDLVPTPKTKERAGVARAYRGLFDPIGYCVSHSAMIRDFVKTFVPDDCFPVFHNRNHTILCGTY